MLLWECADSKSNFLWVALCSYFPFFFLWPGLQFVNRNRKCLWFTSLQICDRISYCLFNSFSSSRRTLFSSCITWVASGAGRRSSPSPAGRQRGVLWLSAPTFLSLATLSAWCAANEANWPLEADSRNAQGPHFTWITSVSSRRWSYPGAQGAFSSVSNLLLLVEVLARWKYMNSMYICIYTWNTPIVKIPCV